MNERPKTIFIDIDGTIFEHAGRDYCLQGERPILPGVLDKFIAWDMKGYNIILVSGRRESDRKVTENQLAYHGLFYDQLILGVGGGVRYLINDNKPNSLESTAYAISIPRNQGLEDVDI
jgi:hydroxymethylpyrimidine pyrophosphatase-like HAD family hydrolase